MSLHQQIKEALSKATPGPWNSIGDAVRKDYSVNGWVCQMFQTFYGQSTPFENDENNAHLIANAPTWLQQLLDELEKAQKEQKVAQKAINVLHADASNLTVEYEQLRTEHAAMKEALIRERDDAMLWDGVTVVARINRVLSTLSKEEQECPTCYGEGGITADNMGDVFSFECPDCKGTGYCHYHGFADHTSPCAKCEGTGKEEQPND